MVEVRLCALGVPCIRGLFALVDMNSARARYYLKPQEAIDASVWLGDAFNIEFVKKVAQAFDHARIDGTCFLSPDDQEDSEKWYWDKMAELQIQRDHYDQENDVDGTISPDRYSAFTDVINGLDFEVDSE